MLSDNIVRKNTLVNQRNMKYELLKFLKLNEGRLLQIHEYFIKSSCCPLGETISESHPGKPYFINFHIMET